jgi:hypothetical protein
MYDLVATVQDPKKLLNILNGNRRNFATNDGRRTKDQKLNTWSEQAFPTYFGLPQQARESLATAHLLAGRLDCCMIVMSNPSWLPEIKMKTINDTFCSFPEVIPPWIMEQLNAI